MGGNPQRQPLRVAVAIIVDGSRVLVARRPAGSHLEGFWEFPGGKVELDESPRDALIREVAEEVGLDVTESILIHRQDFDYPDRSVDISFYLVTSFRGEVRDENGLRITWVGVDELDQYAMPPANESVVQMLREQLM